MVLKMCRLRAAAKTGNSRISFAALAKVILSMIGGTANAARIAMMASTPIISIRVKPCPSARRGWRNLMVIGWRVFRIKRQVELWDTGGEAR